MNRLLKATDGYKTYACAFGIGVTAVLHYLGYIDNELAGMLLTLFGGGGMAALRYAKKESNR